MKKILFIISISFLLTMLSCRAKTEAYKYVFLNEQELSQKTSDELKLIRNEIFARKGHVFKDTLLFNYFKSYNWYNPIKDIRITLSRKEEKYVELIKSIEKDKSNLVEKKDIIFDILDKLPLNLGSWEWSYANRKLFRENVKKGIYETSNDDGLFKKKYLGSEKIIVNVVDGSWVMKLYKVENDTYVVITDDIVTGGNDLKAYKHTMKNEYLSKKTFESLFQKEIIDYFLQKDNTCKESMKKDNFIAFMDYDFYKQDIIMSTYQDDNIDEDCLKYREVTFRFNKEKEKFDFLEGIPFKDEH